jgi:hypothetical protein
MWAAVAMFRSFPFEFLASEYGASILTVQVSNGSSIFTATIIWSDGHTSAGTITGNSVKWLGGERSEQTGGMGPIGPWSWLMHCLHKSR